MGQLATTEDFRHLGKLHKELLHEIHAFENTVKVHQYNAEYVQVCIYVICAVFDDLISRTEWGKDKWETFSLLTEFNLDKNHHERFFSILEHAIQEPEHYIDLMELMYICLSMGYCGQYQNNGQDQAHLEQITNSLYKYIRAYRGNVSKLLSPAPLKPPKMAAPVIPDSDISHWTVILFTACVIMIVFIGLGYLMEMISNEAISKFTDVQKTVARNNLQQ
jgi:type VI secretion system protein ImpK